MAEILNDECDAIGSIVAGACKLAEEAVKELGDLGRAPKLSPQRQQKRFRNKQCALHWERLARYQECALWMEKNPLSAP